MTNINTDTITVAVAISKLVNDPDNVRKIRSDAALEALADSIAAEGLLQNLLVRAMKGGKYAVVGGERRRNALLLLVEQKRLKASDKVPCRLVTDEENALSVSLAENIHRAAMHPVDQFRTFVALADSGLTIAEIAVRHGATEQLIEQRLKLGRLSPVLLDAFANDSINLQIAIAFTLTDDHTQQVAVYESLLKLNYGMSEHRVKAALTEDETPSSNKLVQFVGRVAYEAAGGLIRDDMFDEVFYCQDSALLLELAQEKLEEAAQQRIADGWKWIEQSIDFDHDALSGVRMVQKVKGELSPELQTENDRLEQLVEALEEGDDELTDEQEEKLDKIQDRLQEIDDESYFLPDTDKATAGFYLFIDHDGSLQCRGPLIRSADDPLKAQKKTGSTTTEEPKGYSKALRDDLAAIRLEALRIELLRNASVARDLLAFHTVRDVLTVGYKLTPLGLSIKKDHTKTSQGDMGAFSGRETYENQVSNLKLDWFEIEDAREGFEAFCALSEAEKTDLQAYACVLALLPQLSDEPHAAPSLESAATMISMDMAKHWTPDASFFKRTTKHSMLELAKAQGLTTDALDLLKELRKGDIADSLSERFQASIGTGNGFDTWVPDCMQTGSYTKDN